MSELNAHDLALIAQAREDGEIKYYKYLIDGREFIVKENDKFKAVKSKGYNYVFDKTSGYFERWGITKEDDPQFSPIGPEILDIEISVDGCPNSCPFCYKGNTNKPATNMSFETFKTILDKMPHNLTQIAFGITGVKTNPDFIKMMEYTRSKGIVPNFTLSGIDLDDEMAKKCATLVGGLAVSAYQTNKNICYDAVKKFTDLGVKQCNIHLMCSLETLSFIYEVIEDIKKDKRLEKLNAVIFLGLKPKGRAALTFHPVSSQEYGELVKHCFNLKINFGFDSCSAPKFQKYVKSMDVPEEEKKRLYTCSESCESFGMFSSYINYKGIYFPCSFCENEGEWENGIDVLNCKDFLKDIWYNPLVNKYRSIAINQERNCPIFPEINI